MNATSKVTKVHYQSNREKLQAAHDLILSVSHDDFHGPTTFEHMTQALDSIEEAMRFPLNEAEQHELRMATLAEAVPVAEHCETCGELQSALGYCVTDEVAGHSRYETSFVHTRFTESETSSLYDRS